MMTRKKKSVDSQKLDYKTFGETMMKMTEQELRSAIQAEVDRGMEARFDLLKRLVGRFNRLRGARCQRDVLRLVGESGASDVNTVLDRNS